MCNKINTILLILLGILMMPFDNLSAAPLALNLEPGIVNIGTFYNGTSVKVMGQVPAGAEVVVRLSDEGGEDLHLKTKGKVAGVLWMNTGDLTLHHAPKVYKLITSAGLADLDKSNAKDFGFAALGKRIEISPESEKNDFYLKEFIRLKEESNIYSIQPDGVQFGEEHNGMRDFQAAFTIPSKMTQGNYTVEAAAVIDGNIVDTASSSLVLKQVGFPEQLSNMAFGKPLFYGIMSVVIALLAGLIMGIVFKDKGGAH